MPKFKILNYVIEYYCTLTNARFIATWGKPLKMLTGNHAPQLKKFAYCKNFRTSKYILMSLPQKNTYRLHCFQPGLQYAEILEHWKLVKIGDAVDLIPEPENKEDQNAVKVVYQGKPLGYLPR